jgi:hypothetical protein
MASTVIPAKSGIQSLHQVLAPGVRRGGARMTLATAPWYNE